MQSGPTLPDLRSIQDDVVAKRFDDALKALDKLLSVEPDNPEALYMSAVCRRYKNDCNIALEVLQRLKFVAPEHGRAHQEEGHTYRDIGKLDEALLAYSRACRFNPALESSWRGQLQILISKRLDGQAQQVRAQLQRLQMMPRELVAVTDLIAQGRLLKAEEACRQFMKQVPDHVEGMRLLADIGSQLGVLDDAEFLLESGLKFDPGNIQVRIDYIRVLRKRQKFQRALEEAEKLLERSPQNPQFRSLYAVECMQTGDYEKALVEFDAVLDQIPGDPVTLTSKGHAYKTLGEYDLSVDAYKAALKGQPDHGEAYYSLANLKVYSFSDDEIEKMHGQEANSNLSHIDRVYLCFALGKAYEDQQEFEQSFSYYARGNQLKKAQSRYDAVQMAEDLDGLKGVCTTEIFSKNAGSGYPGPDPIFILGLPRSGSTLLEQILSSHTQVDGTLELPNILSLSQRLRRRARRDTAVGYPEIIGKLTADELEVFGEEYIRDTRIHRQDAPFFIDKMPNNFRYIGLIKLILPNAKVIDARRSPMSCCFSGFKQLFAEGQEFSYDLQDVGRYYRDYVALMDHWDKVLPGFVLRVNHEDVVSDLETEVKRMLEFCNLPFEKSCVEFHKTERSVRTPSSEQVRQPIYTSGLKQWHNFEAWLGPLKGALGSAIDRYAGEVPEKEKG